jgi:Uma2 family endonuclease
MSLQPKPHLSFDDWLEGERAALEGRSEYVGGEVFAMTGAMEAHNAIVTNIVGQLWAQMKGRPCQVYANDMKVRIRAADAGTYPDLVALCGEREFQDGRRDLLLNPSLIVEVLAARDGRDVRNAGAVADNSDSTEAYDRGDKFGLYRRIPSLQEYLLVSQHRVQVELYSRGEDGRWTLRDYSALADSVALTSVGCTLALAEVYDKVEFLPA